MIAAPLKSVIAWYATAQNETPPGNGWEVCDGRTLDATQQEINPGGTYVLPDLRNRFLLGADRTLAPGTPGDPDNDAASAPGPEGAGGVHAKTLASTEIVPHTHSLNQQLAGAVTNAPPGGTTRPSGTTSTSSAGGGSAYDQRPRYCGLVFLMRVKV